MKSVTDWLVKMGFPTEGGLEQIVRTEIVSRMVEAHGLSPAQAKRIHVPFPSSLQQLLGCDKDPKMDTWEFLLADPKEDGGWASDLQGLTHDGVYWYLVQKSYLSQRSGPPFKKTGSHNELHLSHVNEDVNKFRYYHFGDSTYSSRLGHPFLFVPVEHLDKRPALIARISLQDRYADGEYLFLKGASGLLHSVEESGQAANNPKGPWCAVNPLDGLLYSSNFDDVNRLFVFDPSSILLRPGHPLMNDSESLAIVEELGLTIKLVDENFLPNELWEWSEETGVGFFELKGDFFLWEDGLSGPEEVVLSEVQGGCFSDAGQLFLSTNEGARGLHGFSGLSGRRLGYRKFGGPEIEGVTIWNRRDVGRGDVHVAILDDSHTIFSDDDAEIKHWKTPDESGVV